MMREQLKKAVPATARARMRQWQLKLSQRAAVAEFGWFLPQKYVAELAFWKGLFVRSMQDAGLSVRDMERALRTYWVKHRSLNEIEKIVQPKEKRLLDVGCGISSVLRVIKARERVAVDPLLKYYRQLVPEWDTIACETAPVERLPFPDASFDAVFCSNALDHVSCPEHGIREMTRVLRPGGHLVLTVEIFPKTASGEREDEHPFSFDEATVRSLLSDYEIVFQRKTIAPQFRRFMLGMPLVTEGQEFVVVAQRHAQV
jgi:ubiquinone/menaquinone biosynthesis C-methylase UbiE